jgi:hypothetical protein
VVRSIGWRPMTVQCLPAKGSTLLDDGSLSLVYLLQLLQDRAFEALNASGLPLCVACLGDP